MTAARWLHPKGRSSRSRPPPPGASLHHPLATAAKRAAVLSYGFTLPQFRGRNASQIPARMGDIASNGVKRPRPQQGEEEHTELTPLHLTAHETLPLPLLALSVVHSLLGMCVSAELCDAQGAAQFPFVRIPPRVRRPFAGAPVHDMSLTHGERLRVVGSALTGKLVRLLSLGAGRSSTATTSTVSTTTAPTPITGTSTTTRITTIVSVTTHYPRHFEPHSNWRACHKLMHLEVAHVAAKLMHSLVGNKLGKEAEELCASGQCAAAAVALKLAVDLGHLPSRALLAWILQGTEGVVQDHNRAFELVEEGTRLGCHHCQGVMAYCYRWGHGCERDCARSLELARESARKGSRYGQGTLGEVYDGEDVYIGVVQDYAQALAMYQLAAAQNLDMAQWKLGFMYCRGNGVAQDLAEALRLYHLAAAQGHHAAMYCIAYCHEEGRGVRKNKAEAIRWYRRAQEAGFPGAAGTLQRLRA
jgi:TPR repeat protein